MSGPLNALRQQGDIVPTPLADTLRDLPSYAGRALAAGVGGAGAMLGAGAAFMPRKFNRMTMPIQRALQRPHISAEAVASSVPNRYPLTTEQSDALYSLARAHHEPFQSADPLRRQGAWIGPHGFEANPLYVTPLARHPGPISENIDALRSAASLGEHLQQDAVPVLRGMPFIRNVPDDANALFMRNASPEQIKILGQELSPQSVAVNHMPSKDAMMFGYGDNAGMSMEDLQAMVRRLIPGAETRFGQSTEGLDRMVTTRDDWGAPNRTYRSLNAVAPLNQYRNMEDDILSGRLPFVHPRIRE